MPKSTRRKFLENCTAGAVAAAPLVAAPFAMLPSQAAGIESVARNGTPKFKFSLAAYSYRNLLEKGRLTLSDFVADCAKMQLEGTELTSYYFPNPVTEDYLRKLKGECFRAGLSISGTAIGNDFGFPAGEERDQQIADTKRWIDHAETLSAPVIRIFAGHPQEGGTDAETHRLMVSGIEECCDYAGQHGVFLALENHGGPTATAEGLMKFVHDVKSPWFGVNLDTGNFHSEDLYGELERVAPYAVNAQVKVVVSGPDGVKKPTDFRRIAKILSGAGYRGFVVLEYEEEGDPRTECPKYANQLREAFA